VIPFIALIWLGVGYLIGRFARRSYPHRPRALELRTMPDREVSLAADRASYFRRVQERSDRDGVVIRVLGLEDAFSPGTRTYSDGRTDHEVAARVPSRPYVRPPATQMPGPGERRS
jgi:hypothetical protein